MTFVWVWKDGINLQEYILSAGEKKISKTSSNTTKTSQSWCVKNVHEIWRCGDARQEGWKGGYVRHYINMRDARVSVLRLEPLGDYFEPSQLKQILRSNFRPVRSLLNYSASEGCRGRADQASRVMLVIRQRPGGTHSTDCKHHLFSSHTHLFI